jgi:hypothetical protein
MTLSMTDTSNLANPPCAFFWCEISRAVYVPRLVFPVSGIIELDYHLGESTVGAAIYDIAVLT